MAFLFGRRQRSASDLVRATKDLLQRLIKEDGSQGSKVSIAHHLVMRRLY